MKHRIAFVSYDLVHGGSLTFLLNISRELQRRGIDHRIVSLGTYHAMQTDFAVAGVDTIRPDATPRLIEDAIRFGLEKLRAFEPTHVVGCLGPQSLEILRYVPKGVSRLGLLQTDDPPVYEMLAGYAPVLDAVVGVSDYSCEVLRSYPQLVKTPVFYQPYGIPTPGEVRNQSSTSHQPIRIAYVGRLVREQKRVHLFPRILQGLKNSGRPFIWRIAGSGAKLSWLKNNLRTDSPDQVIQFEGHVSYERIPELLGNSDILLLPSAYEGLPLSLLEAMAHGVVPVVSDLPSGMREVVNSETGILVDPENVDGYAEAILRLDSDRADLVAKSRNASLLIRHDFSCQAMADRWLKMFDDLAAAPEPWPESQKITYSFAVRRLGLPFLQPVRVVNKLLKKFATK
jgi:colanic acid/amylovoran biosynthesis glycosyltransferase